MSYILMILFLIIYVAIILVQIEYQPDKEDFFNLYDSTMLKGAFCIIVMLVHIPTTYQNRIQDMLGSFAYIGVTFFFLTSAYGLKYGVAHKENYLRRFWLKRLPAILVPAVLCNIVAVAVNIVIGEDIAILSFFNVNDWVKVLLLFYFVFWLVYYSTGKIKMGGCLPDVFICLVVVFFSLIDRMTPLKITLIWPTESIGFAYGIILADCVDWMKKWSDRQWGKKNVLFFLLGGIIGVAYCKFKQVEMLGDYCLKVFLGFVLLMLILQLMRKVKIGNKVLAFLGSISYEIYLLHGTVFTFLAEVTVIENSGVFIWCAVIVTIVFSVIVKKISEPIITIFKDL